MFEKEQHVADSAAAQTVNQRLLELQRVAVSNATEAADFQATHR